MVVRMRSNSSHTGNRRSHHALKGVGVFLCKDCGHPKLMHRVCPNCGKYRGKVIIDVVAKAEKKAKKQKEKAKERK